jgi:hypothetical protein
MPSTNLSPGEAAALHEALEDEYKAWAIYDQVIRDFGEARPSINIRDSEARHIAALSALFALHGLPLPPNTWPGRAPRFESLRAACQAGVDAEIENERLYGRLLEAARHPDMRAVFERLRDASRLRHLPAFRRCVARETSSAAGGARRRRRRGGA